MYIQVSILHVHGVQEDLIFGGAHAMIIIITCKYNRAIKYLFSRAVTKKTYAIYFYILQHMFNDCYNEGSVSVIMVMLKKIISYDS